jgi:hypothetical protein
LINEKYCWIGIYQLKGTPAEYKAGQWPASRGVLCALTGYGATEIVVQLGLGRQRLSNLRKYMTAIQQATS